MFKMDKNSDFKIDLLLINPATISIQNNPIPFGLTYLASFLEKKGFSVKLLDLGVDYMDDESLINYIKGIKPRNIGFGCMTVHVDFVKRITKKIKENIDVKIFVGGIHPTSFKEKNFDDFKDVDIIFIGEGELTLLEVLQGKKLSNIKGIAYKDKGKVRVNEIRELIEDIDILPFPARHLLDSNKYALSFDWEGRNPSTTMFTSRGCPYNCIYCASKVMWRRKVRFRSAENVLNEIDFLIKECGVREILFYDDHFTLNKERLYKICNGLLERKYDLTWGCLSRVDSLDLETLRLMKKAGCHIISFGVESGSQTTLNSMKKDVKVEDIKRAFALCRETGINTKATFIFGAPKETRETINETRNLIKVIKPDYVWFFIMTPMPGTELYDLHQKIGLGCTEWNMYNQTGYNKFYDTDLDYNILKKEVSRAYRGYYLSADYIFSQLRKINSRKIRVWLRILRYLPSVLKTLK